MALIDYTTPDSIRALLGVSAKELKDTVIDDDVYLIKVLEKLDSLAADFTTVYAAARDAEPRTSQQGRLVLLVQSFAAYTVALELVPAMPAFAPQTISDGKSEMSRVDNPYAALAPALIEARDYIQMRLKLAYTSVTGVGLGAAQLRRHVSVVSPGADPITG